MCPATNSEPVPGVMLAAGLPEPCRPQDPGWQDQVGLGLQSQHAQPSLARPVPFAAGRPWRPLPASAGPETRTRNSGWAEKVRGWGHRTQGRGLPLRRRVAAPFSCLHHAPTARPPGDTRRWQVEVPCRPGHKRTPGSPAEGLSHPAVAGPRCHLTSRSGQSTGTGQVSSRPPCQASVPARHKEAFLELCFSLGSVGTSSRLPCGSPAAAYRGDPEKGVRAHPTPD